MLSGIVVDNIGPRYTMLLSGALTITGALLFGFPIQFIAGYVLMGLGGAAVLISTYRVGYVFPSKMPLILAAASCLFDASSVVFVVFEALYQGCGVSMKSLFIGFASVTAVLQTLSAFLLTPDDCNAMAVSSLKTLRS